MEQVRLGKVVLHISVGNNWDRLQKARDLLESLTGQTPITRRAKKTVKAFNITQNDPMSCLVTLRGDLARDTLDKMLEAVGGRVKATSFDRAGNFAFGIGEHLDIPGVKYDPAIGIFGLDVAVELVKSGNRVKVRKYKRSALGDSGKVEPAEGMRFVEEEFGVEVT
jgi:large subunit ribosomal protein L5